MKEICIETKNENARDLMKRIQASGGTDISSRRLSVDTSIIKCRVPHLVGLRTWCRTKFQKGTKVYFSI